MISPQEFIAQCGTDNLVRYNEAIVERLNIPTASKQFLIEAGWPQRYFYEDHTFQVLPDLPFLEEAFEADYPIPLTALSYRVFCTVSSDDFPDIWKFYCLDEQANGRVMQVSWRGRPYLDACFLNSSVSQFAEFLLVIRELKRWLRVRIDEQERSVRPFRCSEADLKLRLVRQKLRRIDPDAWTVICEGEKYSVWEMTLFEIEMYTGCTN